MGRIPNGHKSNLQQKTVNGNIGFLQQNIDWDWDGVVILVQGLMVDVFCVA